MNNVWLWILGIMVAGSVLKYAFINPFAAVAVDLAVLAAAYFILRRYPLIDFKRSMLLLVGLTAVNILVDLHIVSGFLANIAFLAFIAWMIFGRGGGGSGRPPRLRHKWHK